MSVAGGMREAELQNCLSMTQSLLGGKITRSQRQDCPPSPSQLPTQLDLSGVLAPGPATTTSAAVATTHFLLTLLEESRMKPRPREPC